MKLDSVAYKRMWAKYYALMAWPTIASIVLGIYFEKMEANRMSRYRDKSALYGRELAPGEPPTWP